MIVIDLKKVIRFWVIFLELMIFVKKVIINLWFMSVFLRCLNLLIFFLGSGFCGLFLLRGLFFCF